MSENPYRIDGPALISFSSEGELLQEVIGDVCTFRDMLPEEDESWESWYYAAFGMLTSRVRETFARNLAADNSALAPVPEREAVGVRRGLWQELLEIDDPLCDEASKIIRSLSLAIEADDRRGSPSRDQLLKMVRSARGAMRISEASGGVSTDWSAFIKDIDNLIGAAEPKHSSRTTEEEG